MTPSSLKRSQLKPQKYIEIFVILSFIFLLQCNTTKYTYMYLQTYCWYNIKYNYNNSYVTFVWNFYEKYKSLTKQRREEEWSIDILGPSKDSVLYIKVVSSKMVDENGVPRVNNQPSASELTKFLTLRSAWTGLEHRKRVALWSYVHSVTEALTNQNRFFIGDWWITTDLSLWNKVFIK